jgi:hypothetical protein
MARLGVSKKKKSPRATELSQLKEERQEPCAQSEGHFRFDADAGLCQSALSTSFASIRCTPRRSKPGFP